MSGIATALLGVGSAVLAAPAASAADEFTLNWSLADVRGISDGLGRADLACAGATGGLGRASNGVVQGRGGTAVEIAVNVIGQLCGRNDPELRAVTNEALVKGCGIDATFIPGKYSFDTAFRYVVCP